MGGVLEKDEENTRKLAIESVGKRHINRLRMEDKAYRYIYGRPVVHSLRIALIALLQEYAHKRYDIHPESQLLLVDQRRVQDKVSRSHIPPQSENTARKALAEAISFGLMTKAARGEGLKGNKAYIYFSGEQYEKVKRLHLLFIKIDEVIAAQSRSPDNKWAGNDIVPREVFYNIEADDGL